MALAGNQKKSRIKRTYPADIIARLKQAISMHRMGLLSQAEASYKDILKSYPDHPDANHLFGVIQLSKKQFASAENHIKIAINSAPKNAEYHHNLGVVYKESGRIIEARRLFQKAVKLNRTYANAYNSLGSINVIEGEYKEAKKNFMKAIEIDPQSHDALFNLSKSLRALKEYNNASNYLEKLSKKAPDDPEVKYELFNCYVDSGRVKEAISFIKQEISNQHDNIFLKYKLSQLYERQSMLDHAMLMIEEVSKQDPSNPKYILHKAVILRRLKKFNDALECIQNIDISSVDSRLSESIHFELGRLYDRIGDYDSAFANYEISNKLQLDAIDIKLISKERFQKHVLGVTENLTREWIGKWKKCDAIPDANHVFMVAFPRSGTTLLDQILDGHSHIQVMEEQPIIGEIINEINKKNNNYPQVIASLRCSEIKKYRQYYYNECRKYLKREKGSILIDKLPLNIVEIELIYRLFPNSKIILSLRHPYDVCISNFMQHYDLNDAMANFTSLEDAAKTYNIVMNLWEKYTAILPINYHCVKYEDLVDDAQVQAAGVIRFLGLNWEEQVLDHVKHAKTRKIDTPSYQQVTESIYSRSMYRWKNYLRYIEKIKPILRHQLEYFEYEQ
ncbi:MAG: tetratricopeptide repeat protein [Sulfurovum sp.]|nr:sulfotransferase [Sulfurovum sp.]NNJ45148.1 tetratricopeptide repeat protein [Sulfurovum sp.]